MRPGRSAGLLFLSGGASLVFETLWVKQLGLVVGVDVYAVTIRPRRLLRRPGPGCPRPRPPGRPLAPAGPPLRVDGGGRGRPRHRDDACLEPLGSRVRGTLGGRGPAGVPLAVRPRRSPRLRHGRHLPALVRATSASRARPSGISGLLYAANTAGAIVGTLATPFALLPRSRRARRRSRRGCARVSGRGPRLSLEPRTVRRGRSSRAPGARALEGGLPSGRPPLRDGGRPGPRLRGRLVPDPGAVPQHPLRRLRRPARDLPRGSRPRERPLGPNIRPDRQAVACLRPSRRGGGTPGPFGRRDDRSLAAQGARPGG